MSSMHIQGSMRLPALLDQPSAGQHCACDPWRRRDRARDGGRMSFIDADVVADRRLGRMLTTGIRASRPTGAARISIAAAR